MMRILFAALMVAMVAVACTNTDNETVKRAKSKAEQRQELAARIDSLENIMEEEDLLPEDETMGTLLKSYIEYTEKYPADMEKTPEYLYKAAAVSRAVDLPVKAIKLYDKILSKYPNWEKAPEVAFLQAFTYDEDLKEAELAKESYEEVIEKYPGDLWAVQAEQRLATIEMSDEELLEFLKKKHAESAGSTQ
jgi:tetratricopeptide (TPR) repeat protein